MISKRICLETQTYPASDDRYRDTEPGQDASQVKWLLEKHKNDIGEWLNIPELLPHLRRRRLINSDKDRQRMLSWHDRGKRSRICTRLRRLLASCCNTHGPGVYVEFLSCLREEHEHLGHYYIAKLLLGVPSNEFDHDVIMSRWIREIIRSIEPLVQSCLSLKSLLPFLWKVKLLTSSEFELLHEDSSKENSWKIQKLLVILNTKGPAAHYLFFRCLEQEKEHRGHDDIYKEICRLIDIKFHNSEVSMNSITEINNDELFLIAVCEPHTRTPCRLGLEGSLGRRQHISEMRELQQHRYHGRWDCFQQGINELTESDDINVTAVGMLHNAVASIMSGNTDLSLRLVDEVEKMCSTLYGNNNQILMGRCLYIRSAVYRHHQDYDSARRYLDLSKQVLTHSEPGADTASLYYHEGTLWLDLLHQNGSTHERKEREKAQAEHSFRMAIEHAEHNNSGLPLIAWHSKVFLALLYLGSSHDSLSHESPSIDDLNLAESVLETLDQTKLPARTLALYHIAFSDIYRWKCDLALAKHHVNLGLSKAEQGNFAFEKRFATHRLQHLYIL